MRLGLALRLLVIGGGVFGWHGSVEHPSRAAAMCQERPDLLVADFEGLTYDPWITTGQAFGPGPAAGTLPGQMEVSGYQGQRLVNSFYQGDASTGTLTSPEFRLQRRYLSFLIGGGRDPERLALQLLLDGQVVKQATGLNDQAGGSEALELDYWDVGEFLDRQVQLRVIDQATGGWGHLNVDHIVQTDTRPRGFLQQASRQWVAATRYLNLPIRNGAPKRLVTLVVDGQNVVQNEIELADDHVDWWAPMDISHWAGRSVTLQVDRLPESSLGLERMEASDEIKHADNLYREPLRGQIHFSPRRGWSNDPNGMVYFRGEYHLFFQHNPYGWGWGNMHWGHAISRDLVHWQELRDELLPDAMGPMFSGSAVVDWHNTSGFGQDGQPPLVLFYTAAGNPTVQGLAYSLDGRHFTKFDGNPILPEVTPGNRDPKVIWHAESQRWIMVLYVEQSGKHTVHFYSSPNLKDWELSSVVEGDPMGERYLFECPDFFPLAVDGDSRDIRWVLTAADGQYAIGTFDGREFRPQHERLPSHAGRGYYAAQTFSDEPSDRRIQMAWWQTETRGMPFNQSMTLPVELSLVSTADGPRLAMNAVPELAALRTQTHDWEPFQLRPGATNPLQAIRHECLEIQLEFPVDAGATTAEEIVLNIRDVMVVYWPRTEMLRVDDRMVSAPARNGRQRLVIYCDRTGVEVFASDGLCYVPLPYPLKPENQRLFFEARGGNVQVAKLQVHELGSIWAAPSELAPLINQPE